MQQQTRRMLAVSGPLFGAGLILGALVLGAVAVLGPLGQLAFILSPLWVPLTGVLLSRRSMSERDAFVASAERA